jgi:hypothetical protein
MIRILLADDHAVVRKALRYVVILDISMPGRGGLDVLLPNGLRRISKMMSRGSAREAVQQGMAGPPADRLGKAAHGNRRGAEPEREDGEHLPGDECPAHPLRAPAPPLLM